MVHLAMFINKFDVFNFGPIILDISMWTLKLSLVKLVVNFDAK